MASERAAELASGRANRRVRDGAQTGVPVTRSASPPLRCRRLIITSRRVW